jgi:hypothetical protein
VPFDVRAVTGDFDGQRIIDTLADNVAEFVGRQERFAGLFDLHLRIGISNGHFKIGGGDGQTIIGSREFDTQQDGFGRTRLYGITGDRQRFEKSSPIANHFHEPDLSISHPLGIPMASPSQNNASEAGGVLYHYSSSVQIIFNLVVVKIPVGLWITSAAYQ